MAKRENTISDQVYSAIRLSIMTLKIPPGTVMSEKEIGERLNVSRTPVREAFIRLAKEGLVQIYPQRGTHVSKISIARAKEERFLRECLEMAVLREFMQRHGENAIERLKHNIEQQKQALAQGAWDQFMDYDDQFHSVFYQETGKLLCNDVIQQSNVDYYRLRCLSVLVSGGIASRNLDQHIQLLAYIQNKDEAAMELLAKHLRKIFQELDEMQEKYPGYFFEESTDAANLQDFVSSLAFGEAGQ